MVYAIAAMLFLGLGGVAAFAIWFTNDKSRQLGREEAINTMQAAEREATDASDIVLNQHRTTDDSIDRLRTGRF